jgi:hypothetical protein
MSSMVTVALDVLVVGWDRDVVDEDVDDEEDRDE